MPDPSKPPPNASRRNFLRNSAASSASLGLLAPAANAQAQAKSVQSEADVAASARPAIALNVNGVRRMLSVEPRTTLVEALRDTLDLTNTNIGCNHGQCGACTVLLDGRRINSCLVLALSADGAKVATVEGLADKAGKLHPMQQAFAEKDAFQCGYCTPGQIMSAIACLEEGHAGSATETREYMSGNICRCGAYPNIVAAVEAVRDSRKG